MKRNRNSLLILTAFLMAVLFSCNQDNKKHVEQANEGSFGYDLKFLKSKDSSLITLQNNDAILVVSPKFQGKVFTSSALGLDGKSFGWINYKAFDTLATHINAYGGEDRMWVGPEGGQFSIFFKKDAKMEFSNWQTPAALDTEPWEMLSHDANSIKMTKNAEFENYSGTKFNVQIDREVKLLNAEEVKENLGISAPEKLKWVAYQTDNQITNIGQQAWTKESGTLNIWMLGMFNPSEKGIIVIPYKQGDDKELGNILTSDYFGDVPKERLVTDNGIIYFKIDGKYRSKIGISPKRASNFVASYDDLNKVLTILKYNKPAAGATYINQKWEIQKEPFIGDVINAYNDGPLTDGTQMGPFYEMETSSPAAFLAPKEKMGHQQQVYHFTGSESDLNVIAEKVLGVAISDIKKHL
jgi:hypothetical protein